MVAMNKDAFHAWLGRSPRFMGDGVDEAPKPTLSPPLSQPLGNKEAATVSEAVAFGAGPAENCLMAGSSRIRCVTLDLDDTVWPTLPPLVMRMMQWACGERRGGL